MNIDQASSSSGLALSFTESPMFINPRASDDSSYPAPNMSYDGVLRLPNPLSSGLWTQPASTLRGGFRYLTIVSTGSGLTSISNVTCMISFMPHVNDMRAYSGYFYAKDLGFHDEDLLTKVCNVPHCSSNRSHRSRAFCVDLVRRCLYGTDKHCTFEYGEGGPVRQLARMGEQCYAGRCGSYHHRRREA